MLYIHSVHSYSYVHLIFYFSGLLIQIIAALQAVRYVDYLPTFQMPEEKERPVNDILEWLALRFGFQVCILLSTSFVCDTIFMIIIIFFFLYIYFL